MQEQQQIENILQKYLEPTEFVVELKVSNDSGMGKVAIFLDSDEGISIDRCGEVSRALGEELEESEVMASKYMLEVSSPGVGEPIKLPRQYNKNIGRDIYVLLNDGTEITGKLVSNNETGIGIQEIQKKKGNKKDKSYSAETRTILFELINKAKVLISFK